MKRIFRKYRTRVHLIAADRDNPDRTTFLRLLRHSPPRELDRIEVIEIISTATPQTVKLKVNHGWIITAEVQDKTLTVGMVMFVKSVTFNGPDQ